MNRNATALTAIKAFHTVVWAFFASCIIALPVTAYLGAFATAAGLFAIVMVEVLILALNRGSCPLTPMAARHTDKREPNFDIYLPRWVAQYNKQIFGVLFVGGSIYALLAWWAAAGP